jgi:hypothetical protein
MRRKRLALLSLAFLGGCTSYYAVTDPSSGKTFYTERVEKQSGGAVSLKDTRSGDMVTLQNSDIREIGKDQYESAVAAPPAGK